MPHRPRPGRENNPIRQLRRILALPPPASWGGHLSQAQLSEIIDIPLDSIRDVECGRVGFTPRMQNRILGETGAAWNETDQCWRFWKQDGPTYTREHFVKYRELIGRHVESTFPIDIFLAALRIKLMLETLPPRQQFKFLFRLNSFLEASRKEFCPDHFEQLFADASGFIAARPELDRENPLSVFRGYPARLKPVCDSIPPELAVWIGTRLDPTDFELVEKTLRRPTPQRKPAISRAQRADRDKVVDAKTKRRGVALKKAS
jgi:hypothetical protein